MKIGNIIYGLSVAVAVLTGCDREIFIDYRSVEPQTVIQGYISNDETQVLVTTTRDMGDSTKMTGLGDARVFLSDSLGFNEELEYEPDGYYRSPSLQTGVPGVTYTLTVERGGNVYTSESVMQDSPVIGSAGFYRYDLMDLEMLVYVVEVEDIVGQENYYCYRMYVNGEQYSWNVVNDKGNPDGTITVTLMCMDEDIARPDMDEDEGMFLHEGDEVTFELQAIDKGAYNYLYSLGVSGTSSSNPVANFSGGALGYFSAYSVSYQTLVFRHDSILDWSDRE